MTRKEKAKRFRLAASDIFEGKVTYSCDALCRNGIWGMGLKYGLMFCPIGAIFKFNGESTLSSIWLKPLHSHLDEEGCYKWRVLALCIAAAMAEFGDF